MLSFLSASLRAVIENFLLCTFPDFPCQRIAHFLGEMADETDRTGNDGNAAADAPGKSQLAQDGANGAGGIDRQRAVEPRFGPVRLERAGSGRWALWAGCCG